MRGRWVLFSILLLTLCGCHRSGSLIGTWSIAAPSPGVIAFAGDGSFEKADRDSGNLAKGTYEVKGDFIIIHQPSDGSMADETYKMQWSNAETVDLVFVPSDTERTLLPGLAAFTLNLRRVNMDEHLPRGPMLSADDQCVQNVRQIAAAMTMYSEDFDEMWPLSNWEELVRPYVRTPEYLSCPAVVRSGAAGGYAYNEDVVGAPSSSISSPMTTPIIFDSDAQGPNAVAGFGQIAKPARHPKGDSVAYADGHVLSIKP